MQPSSQLFFSFRRQSAWRALCEGSGQQMIGSIARYCRISRGTTHPLRPPSISPSISPSILRGNLLPCRLETILAALLSGPLALFLTCAPLALSGCSVDLGRGGYGSGSRIDDR